MMGASHEGRGRAARPPGTDVFTVRILYRDKESPGRFMGVVEQEAVVGQRGFVNKAELWRILDSAGRAPGSRGKRSSACGAGHPPSAVLDLIRHLREEEAATNPGEAC